LSIKHHLAHHEYARAEAVRWPAQPCYDGELANAFSVSLSCVSIHSWYDRPVGAVSVTPSNLRQGQNYGMSAVLDSVIAIGRNMQHYRQGHPIL